MKRISFLLILIIMSSLVMQAQEQRKSIQVVGEAKKEITPDIIIVQLALKEYEQGNRKVTMNTLEKQLVDAVKKLRLPEDALTVENIYGYNWNWKKKKSEEFLATKSFRLKMKDLKSINDLVDLLDERGVNSVNISSYEHSQMEKMKEELKVEAIRSAKAKAGTLLQAIGEELGGALEVVEMDNNTFYPTHRSNMMRAASMESADMSASGYQSDLDVKQIRISSTIRVTFAIK